jgi:hypothetical protein
MRRLVTAADAEVGGGEMGGREGGVGGVRRQKRRRALQHADHSRDMRSAAPCCYRATRLLLLAACVGLHAAAALQLGALPLNVSGFLDVTAPPYLADSSGRTDSTTALQRAVDDARAQFLAVYVPHGTYVTRFLQCIFVTFVAGTPSATPSRCCRSTLGTPARATR